jgi:hypothetical protein
MHASGCLLACNAPRWRPNGGELKGYGKGEKNVPADWHGNMICQIKIHENDAKKNVVLQ